MFRVDEGGQAAGLLRLGDDLEGDGGLAGGLQTEDLDDAAARNAAYTECGVKRDGAGGDDRDGDDGLLGETSRMTEPLPNCFSSAASAVSIALLRSFRHLGAVGGKSRGILTPKTG